jgi:hypothetical protein
MLLLLLLIMLLILLLLLLPPKPPPPPLYTVRRLTNCNTFRITNSTRNALYVIPRHLTNLLLVIQPKITGHCPATCNYLSAINIFDGIYRPTEHTSIKAHNSISNDLHSSFPKLTILRRTRQWMKTIKFFVD